MGDFFGLKASSDALLARREWDDVVDGLELDSLLGMGGPCEKCGAYVEAELTLEDFGEYGLLCGLSKCIAP